MENCLNLIKDIVSVYPTNDIFIIGKGPSIDLINQKIFENSLVIAINDSDRIYPADVTIFNSNWVKKSIENEGINSSLYISSTDFQASNLPRIFFYVNLDHAENIVKQGRTLYSTVVDASKVYDMAKDPMGFKDEARNWPRNIYGEPIKTAPAPLNMDLLLRGVADNFPGAFYETSTMDVVVWFEPIEVYRVKEKEEE